MPTMSTVEAAFCRSAPWRQFAKSAMLPWALADAEVRGRTLELGCGSGAMARALLETHSTIDELVATDYDPAMVTAATRELAEYGPLVRVEQADATALPYQTGEFDTVATFLMLHHTVHWETALTEAVRVLRPGGRLLGFDLTGSAPARLLHHIEGAPHRFLDLGDLRALLAELPLKTWSTKNWPGFVRFHAVRA